MGVDFYHVRGDNASDLVGDLQGVSNIDGIDRTQIAEAWYEHVLAGGLVRVKAGKVDVNSEFAYVDSGGEFLHSSSGISPAAAVAAPTYPDPATSVNLFLSFESGVTLGLGVYDGATQEGRPTGSVGPSTFLGEPADLFWIAELDYAYTLPEQDRSGRVGLGAWKHTGTFDELAGGTSDGTGGLYLVLDQELWRENPTMAEDVQGWSLFLSEAVADGDVSEIERHVGLGVVRTGWIEGRDDDVVGAAAHWVGLSDDSGLGSHETALELFYRYQPTPWCAIKPDLQLVSNPGGDPAADEAWVAAVRIELGL